MELSFSPDEIAFRDEIRAFIRDNLPRDVQQRMIEGREIGKQDIVNWQAKLNAKGWATPHWPKAWGGQDWSPVQEFILIDELQSAPAPQALAFNVSMVGPVHSTAL